MVTERKSRCVSFEHKRQGNSDESKTVILGNLPQDKALKRQGIKRCFFRELCNRHCVLGILLPHHNSSRQSKWTEPSDPTDNLTELSGPIKAHPAIIRTVPAMRASPARTLGFRGKRQAKRGIQTRITLLPTNITSHWLLSTKIIMGHHLTLRSTNRRCMSNTLFQAFPLYLSRPNLLPIIVRYKRSNGPNWTPAQEGG
jgi:hypothetical protein